MSQGAEVLCVALIAALGATALIAVVTARRDRTARLRGVWAYAFAVMIVGASLFAAMGLRINFTASVPVGVYRVIATPREIRAGMLVAVCQPPDAAALALRRGYLLRGRCAYGTEPLLKHVVAVGGDEVQVAEDGIYVDRKHLAHSVPLAKDCAGRALRAWPVGKYRLMREMIWVYADNARSWDSRYWGPLPMSNVLAAMRPLVLIGDDP